MSLLDRLEPDPKEDLYFEFKVLFDILNVERKKRDLRRRTFVVTILWYEREFKEMAWCVIASVVVAEGKKLILEVLIPSMVIMYLVVELMKWLLN